MARIEHTIGERFARLVIASTVTRQCRSDPKKLEWFCRCDCGKELFVRAHALRSGRTKSCGCLAVESKHKRKGSPVYKDTINSTPGRLRSYRSWEKMKDRCFNPKNKNYKHYGGRGITIIERWLESFDNFFDDMGERPEGLSIGRKNNDGNYEPGNCRWENLAS